LEGLLTLFVALTAIAIITQAGVLLGIYVMSRRLSDQVERFMKDTREMMVPVRSIAENLRIASANIVEIGLSARDQFRRVETMVTDTGEALHMQLERFDRVSQNIIDRINETAEIVQDSVVRPAREVAAVAKGLTRGFGAFFFGRGRSTVDQARQDEELFI
jgi:methylthioribose-1-phosphate isomerase